MNKIKTFEGACKALKLDPKKCLPVVSGVPLKHRKALIAHAKLVIIAQALNEGWKPDWKDYNQWKYYPWFDMSPGSGFSFHDYDYVSASSTVGSRLCFKSRDLAEYAGKQFEKLYKEKAKTSAQKQLDQEKANKSDNLAKLFIQLLKSEGLPEPVREYPFHDTRKWRFDLAWPAHKIALEVEGGVWTSGRHTRGTGFVKDMEKYNAAGMLGWTVLRCVPDDLLKQVSTLKTILIKK